jgi:tetratricopeptide (TPR) repeat protein
VKGRCITKPLFAILSLFMAGTWQLAAQATSDPSAAHLQADAFLAKASAEIAAGTLENARNMVASALELSPDYSEALFLRARIELTDRAMTLAAIDDLRASLRSGTWSATDPSTPDQILAGALLRTGKLAEARLIAERLAASRSDDPLNLLLLARTHARSGDAASERKALDDAAARFPENDDFRLLSSLLLERQGRRAASVEVIATGLHVHPDSLPLLLAAARLERDAKKKATAVDLYLQKSGTDPLSAVLALEVVPTADRKKYLDLFLAQNGLARQDLIDRAVASVKSSKDLSVDLQSALARYSGDRDLDANNDGFWEDRWVFDKGTVLQWMREPSEDGVAQFSAEFQGGAPAALTYSTGQGIQVKLRYSRYPFIESAAIAPGSTYLLVPYTTQCAFLQSGWTGSAGLAPRIAARFVTPSISKLREASYRLEERAADGRTLLRRSDLSRGRLVYMEEDADNDGILDHRVWYVNGSAVRGERSLAANDGFPVKETWKDGALASEAIDTDGDGTVDFRQTFGPHAMKSWDYNEDGKDDSREYRGANGTLVREISTALNGVFDLRISYEGARIVSVTRAGAPIPVSRDAARGVTWIGLPAVAGAVPDTALPDGAQTLGGREYLVFHHEGIAYAEAVR